MNDGSRRQQNRIIIRNSYTHRNSSVKILPSIIVISATILQNAALVSLSYVFMKRYDASGGNSFRAFEVIAMLAAIASASIRAFLLNSTSVESSTSEGNSPCFELKLWALIMWWMEILVASVFVLAIFLGAILNFKTF